MFKNKKLNLKKKKGSVLIFSLLIMMISLIIGISIMTTDTASRKSTLSSDKSVNSFQWADQGLEYALRTIRKKRSEDGDGSPLPSGINEFEGDETLKDVFDSGNLNNWCNNGVVDNNVNSNDGYKIYFYRATGCPACVYHEMNSCEGNDAELDEIKKIKSIGTYKNTIRAVEVDVDFSSSEF